MEILPLVEDVVRLRKSGGTYKGLCPFHQERTPSFTVSPARGTFKCFGCGEGGDAITFVEKTENVDFVSAIELLARRFGVEQPGLPIARAIAGGQTLYATWEDMQCDIWGPRKGKSSSRAIPTLLAAPGSAFATSNKPDLYAATRSVREQGGRVLELRSGGDRRRGG